MRSIRTVTAVVGALTTMLVALSTGAAFGQVEPGPAAPPVAWGPCDLTQPPGLPPIPSTYECGTYQVPLDHADPGGETIELALIKRPATAPAARLGSLFVNPGGPSGSGFDLVAFAGEFLFRPEVLAAYDLVGFDPRGTNRSTPLQCFDGSEDPDDYFTDFIWPQNRREVAEVKAVNHAFDRRCEELGGPIRDHMSTTDVARDLDLLRQAVGDEQLNYVGFSYGSILGSYYANLFPQHVGALVVDAVVDPVRWATGREQPGRRVPTWHRFNDGADQLATAEEFFRLCDEAGPERCAFAGDASARWFALYDTLEAEPLVLSFPSQVFDHQALTAITLQALYSSPSWPQLAEDLAYLEALAADRAAAGTPEVGERVGALLAGIDPGYRGREQFWGVICTDTVEPTRISAWVRAAAGAVKPFGEAWAWADHACEQWSAADLDRYDGPFDAETGNPVLIASTTFDPATPYGNARLLKETLPNSVLLTVQGWGHTTPFLSTCADDVTTQYLLTRTVSQEETVCAQDLDPFPAADSLAAAGDQDEDEAERLRNRESLLDLLEDAPGVCGAAGVGGSAATAGSSVLAASCRTPRPAR